MKALFDILEQRLLRTVAAGGDAQPHLDLTGNTIEIPSGMTEPNGENGTAFGIVQASTSPPIHGFSIANTGPATLMLSAVTLPNGFFGSQINNVQIEPGQHIMLYVAMDTLNGGAHTGAVTLQSNDPATPSYQFTVGGTIGSTFIDRAYHVLLHRDPDAGGEAYWVTALAHGLSPDGVTAGLAASTEFHTIVVKQYYRTILGRVADSAGLTNWVAALDGGATLESVQAALFGSAEYMNGHGGTLAGAVQGWYLSLLDRGAQPSDTQFWTSNIGGGEAASDAVYSILRSGEFAKQWVEGLYERYLHRNADATGLSYWSHTLLMPDQSEELVLCDFLASSEYVGHT